MAWIGILVLAVATAILFFTHDSGSVGGLSPDAFARLAQLSALALVIGAGALVLLRQRWRTAALHAAAWIAIAFVLIAAYAYRGELSQVGLRVYGELVPGAAVTSRGPDGAPLVRVSRSAGGSFAVEAEVNGAGLVMLVDTGASAVTLTEADASAAGYDVDALTYSIPVQTANGIAQVAPVTLTEIRVGPIVERDVRALVAAPGVLHRSLLGMTFLERLRGYEVRGGTLTLHPGH